MARKTSVKSIRYIVSRLKKLKSLRYWKINGGKDFIRFKAPKSHSKFAAKYIKTINDWLKIEGVMRLDVKLHLVE